MRFRPRLNAPALVTVALIFLLFIYSYERNGSKATGAVADKQIIHIVLIVVDNDAPTSSGLSVCERVETLLKSILVFYSGHLHVHLITSVRSGKILTTLFRTWPLARVRTSIYHAEEDQQSLAWVKSTHTVSGYGQLKYIIHDILPEYVERAIFIDSDMLVLEDLSILYSYFSEMEQKGIMFATTADLYPRRDLEKSFGKGASKKSVNSGLVLYNLKAMRSGGWTGIWREKAVEALNRLGQLDCPQDLLAAVAMATPKLYLKLPCVYNFQIGHGAQPGRCIKNKTDLWKAKIPHWSSLKKYYATEGPTAFFSPIYRCFQKLDGYEFEMAREDEKYRTLMHLRNTKRDEKADDVTLAVYLNYEEAIEVIQRLNEAWLGPISLTICGDSWERAQLLSFIFSNKLHDLFDIHFVYERQASCPVDYLRRVAIDASRTNKVLLTDSTSIELDEDLRRMCASKNMTKATYSLNDKKTDSFVGVLLERSDAQRVAAGSLPLDNGIKALKIKFHVIDIDRVEKVDRKFKKWELKMPTDSFCQHEIDFRKNLN